jgi:hypothetical protein
VSPDVYGAWLTAGNNLQPAGAWLADWWPFLTGTAVLAVIGWAFLPTRSDYRSRNDISAAARVTGFQERPEPGQPGSNVGLYLDCVAIYSDCEELDRLRDAINQHRKGERP